MKSNSDAIIKGDAGVSLARLYSGNLSHAEALAIAERATGDDKFRQDYLTSLELLADIDSLANDPEILEVANQPRSRSFKNGVAGHWPMLSLAASVLLAFAVLILNISRDAPEGIADKNMFRYATRVGEQKTVNLEDGSVITLNTATRLTVDIDSQTRHIRLDHGEAYFAVAPDPERPFTVDLGARSISVLGTEFNIRKLPDHYQVAVIKGMVAIHKSEEDVSAKSPLLSMGNLSADKSSDTNKEVRLTAPKQRRIEAGWVADFDVANNQLVGYPIKNVGRLNGWRTGLIRFYKEPLYKVVQELNRYSGKKILIEDTDIMDLRVYAAVDINQLTAALNGLEKLLPIKVTSHFDRIVIVGR